MQDNDAKSMCGFVDNTYQPLKLKVSAKGVCRTITQEFQLASEYHDNDMLSAECFWTLEHVVIHGRDYVAKVEHLSKDQVLSLPVIRK